MATKETSKEQFEILEQFKLINIDGVNYAQGTFFKDARSHLKRIKDIELRNDDVITVGFPRTGNHWAFEVVNMILHQTTQHKKESFAYHILDNRSEDKLEAISKEASPRQIVTHYRVRALPSQVVEKKVKIIYLLRNLKDVLPSMYKLWQTFKDPNGTRVFKGTFDDFLKLSLSGDFTYGSWFDHVLEMERFMNDHPEVPVYIHCYEHMIENPEKAIKDLCHFLKCSDEIAYGIAKSTHVDVMRDLEKIKALSGVLFKGEKENYLVGKGGTGKWKESLTVSQSELIDEMFEEKMAESKLGAVVRPYMS